MDMSKSIRTDLASEAHKIWKNSAKKNTELKGVIAEDTIINGFEVTKVKIIDEEGSQSLGKPKGNYITIQLDKLLKREEDAFADCTILVADLISELTGDLPKDKPILVVGLGNEDITPDAIGPWAIDNILVTHHLKQMSPEDFEAFGSVVAIRPGVLGTTGIESGKYISTIAKELKPSVIIVIDALASGEVDRLCRTVQITDTGITPGSGVGNAREKLNKFTMGVPVIAIGVPTVVDASSFVYSFANEFGFSVKEDLPRQNTGMIVTPRDIDKTAKDTAKLVGYSINLALHKGLLVEEVDMFLS